MALSNAAKRRRHRRLNNSTTQQEFDPVAARQRDILLEKLAAYNSQYNRNVNTANTNYFTNRRGLDEQLPMDMRRDLNNFAARGMAYSSGYGTSVGDIERNYANKYADLASGRSQYLGGLRSTANQYRNQIRFNLEDLRRQAYQDQLAQAAKRRQRTLSLRQQIAGG